jgi:hypothetical protein
MKLEEEIKKLVIHTIGTEMPQVKEGLYSQWKEDDEAYNVYFNPHKYTWSTSLAYAYSGHVHEKLKDMIAKAVKQRLKELGHED